MLMVQTIFIGMNLKRCVFFFFCFRHADRLEPGIMTPRMGQVFAGLSSSVAADGRLARTSGNFAPVHLQDKGANNRR
ncbi:hypothetical protein DWB84_05690 [Saccharophagus sp. K07]|nr:hypothetical protein [Saccharophagus sp. K07]